MTSFSIRNFGCRVNQAEAFDWALRLQDLGFRYEGESGRGDVVIVNTCTLTARADRDALKFIRRTSRENSGARLVVTGCLAERDADGLRGLPGVSAVVPNAGKAGLLSAVLAGDRAETAGGPVPAVRPFRTRGLVKIQDGCDMACAFCVIPAVRGPGRSVQPGEVLDSIGRMAARGAAEVVLTGIHLGSYGRDLEPRTSLLELLRGIDGLPGRFLVRLSSLDPRLLPEPLLDHLGASPRLCRHFHLSLQHGSDRVLTAMGRGGRAGAGRDRALLDGLRERSPEAALGADIIVGYPGETEEDFAATVSLIEASPLSYVHVFAFSPRPGTRAADGPQLDGATKKRRATAVRKLSARKDLEFRRGFVGRVLDGVVIRSRGEGRVLTTNGIEVRIPSRPDPFGGPVRVRLLSAEAATTRGELVAT